MKYSMRYPLYLRDVVLGHFVAHILHPIFGTLRVKWLNSTPRFVLLTKGSSENKWESNPQLFGLKRFSYWLTIVVEPTNIFEPTTRRSSNALFELDWQGDGAVAFRANNGKYLMTKRSGHLYANSDTIDDNCKYYFYLINRWVYCF